MDGVIIRQRHEIIEVLKIDFSHKANTSCNEISILPFQIERNVIDRRFVVLEVRPHTLYDSLFPFVFRQVKTVRIEFVEQLLFRYFDFLFRLDVGLLFDR